MAARDAFAGTLTLAEGLTFDVLPADVQRALERLDTVVDDDGLRLLAEDWTRRTDRRTGGY